MLIKKLIMFICADITYILIQEKELVEFSESIDSYDEKATFQDMNVSRPIMKVQGKFQMSHK